MFFLATKLDIQFIQVFQQSAEGVAFGHFGISVDILVEALATVAILAVGARDVVVGVVDIARKEDAELITFLLQRQRWMGQRLLES